MPTGLGLAPGLSLAPDLLLPPDSGDPVIAQRGGGRYTALLVQRRVRSANGSPVWEDQAATLRIPLITSVTYAQEQPGGFTEGTFTIPAEHARFDPADVKFNTTVWLFDGSTPIFYGHVLKAIPLRTGEITVNLNGAYRKLGDTRMRIVWGDGDLSHWQAARGNTSKGTVAQPSDGSLRFVMNQDVAHGSGSFIAADYYLFGEPVGPRDRKLIDGIRIDEDGVDLGTNGNWEIRLYGLEQPGDPDPDLLYSAQNTNPVSRSMVADGNSGDDATGWPNKSGYRCLRIGLWCIGDTTPSADRVVSFGAIRISTRARQVKLLDQHQTSTLIKDLWDDAANGYDIHHLIQEEYQPSTGEIIVGNIPNNGHDMAGVSFPDWSSPQEIIETLVESDGSKCGMWFPARTYPLGSHVASSGVSKNPWYRQPAMLVYEDWPPLHKPDYLVRLQRGASWEPDGQGDEITEATYTNYSTSKGRAKSVFAEDKTEDNWLYQQGWHEASDWQVDPPVGDATAGTLASQYNQSKQQPTLSGTLTVTSDTLGSITGRGGERITKLSTLRLGVVRIVDAKGPRAGRITRIEYSARSGDSPETAVLTINSAISERLARRLARLARRADQQRTR